MTSSPIFAWLRLLAGLATIGAAITQDHQMNTALLVMGVGFVLGGVGALLWPNHRPGYVTEGLSLCMLLLGAVLLYR